MFFLNSNFLHWGDKSSQGWSCFLDHHLLEQNHPGCKDPLESYQLPEIKRRSNTNNYREDKFSIPVVGQ